MIILHFDLPPQFTYELFHICFTPYITRVCRPPRHAHTTTDCGLRLSPPQRFKRSLYQSAVRSVPQAQSRMDRLGGEPLPDVCRFLVHPCRFLVHRWISRLWLNLTAWNSQKPIANYVATVCICFFEFLNLDKTILQSNILYFTYSFYLQS